MAGPSPIDDAVTLPRGKGTPLTEGASASAEAYEAIRRLARRELTPRYRPANAREDTPTGSGKTRVLSLRLKSAWRRGRTTVGVCEAGTAAS